MVLNGDQEPAPHIYFCVELCLHKHTGFTMMHQPMLATAVQLLLCMSDWG